MSTEGQNEDKAGLQLIRNAHINQTSNCHHIDVLLWLKAQVPFQIHMLKLKLKLTGTLGGCEGRDPVHRLIWDSQPPASYHVNTQPGTTYLPGKQRAVPTSHSNFLASRTKPVLVFYQSPSLGYPVITAQKDQVQNQGVGRAMVPLKPQENISPCPLLQ